jgi:electron transport complex protein RnfD
LIARRVIDWRTPLSLLAAVALGAALLHAFDAQLATPQFWLFSGGLMLGAFFMTTDPVASPLLPRGRVLYGVTIGVLVVVMRAWSGMPEGVMYAILLGNAVSPLIDRWTQPRVYGT